MDTTYLVERESCPWCGGRRGRVEYKIDNETNAMRCESCNLLFSSRILNSSGLKKYWSKYETEVHISDKTLSEKRKLQYELDYNFIAPFMKPNSRVLDVGCSNGDFLELFHKAGHTCEGIEFGEEAFEIASKKFKVYFGQLSEIEIPVKFDLVIFRGTIQYLLNPKQDFLKAIHLLNGGGFIYITGSPNSQALCQKLFKNNFTLPVSPTDYNMYDETILNNYFTGYGMKLYAKTQMYLGTPYEDYENDILKVADAINRKKVGRP